MDKIQAIFSVLVNKPFGNFKYNEDIIINNQEFNTYFVMILIIGGIALLLSWKISSSRMLKCCEVNSTNLDEVDHNNNDVFAKCCKFLWMILVLSIGNYFLVRKLIKTYYHFCSQYVSHLFYPILS